MDDGLDVYKRFEALSKAAYFEVLLPRSTDYDAAALLRAGSPEELSKAPSRRNLFFDENARVQLILKTPADEHEVRRLLPSLEIALAAHATDAVPQGSGNAASASGKHDLTSVTTSATENAEIMEVGEQTYVVWKRTLHIPWPRTRLQRPAIYFTANLTVSAQAGLTPREAETDFLTPYEPLPANVLEPLNFDPAFRGKKVYLSEDKLTKVAPKSARIPLKDNVVKPVRGASKRAFPTMPALFTRMKYSPVPDGTIASLHIETSQVIAGVFDVGRITVHATEPSDDPNNISAKGDGNGTSPRAKADVQSMTDTKWPMQMQAGDETVLLYELIPKDTSNTSSGFASTSLSVAIEAVATLEQGSQIDLDIKWQSEVSPGGRNLDSNYKWSQRLSASSLDQAPLLAQSDTKPASLDDTAKPASGDAGVTFFFKAPATVHQGADFQLKIKCINRIGKLRRFAIVPLEDKRAQTARQQQASSDDADLVAGIFNAPPLERHKPRNVFCDTPDVRVGPIASSASFETEMNFRVLTTGVLDLGGISIVDLDTKQSVDVRDLPDVIALEPLKDNDAYIPINTLLRRDDKVAKEMEAARLQWRKETAEWMAQKGAPHMDGCKIAQ